MTTDKKPTRRQVPATGPLSVRAEIIDPADEKLVPKRPLEWAAVAIAGCAVAISVCCCICWAIPSPGDGDDAVEEAAAIVEPAAHEHDWAIRYETVHHEAQTHEEVVQPVYETATTYHSVCNSCSEIVDGHAQQHVDETGHGGYSTNVPVTESRLVSEGRVDVVEDSPAYDELVETGRACTICGALS